MPRYRKDAINKSVGRNLIREQWKAAWHGDTKSVKADVIFQDALQLLHDVANAPVPLMGDYNNMQMSDDMMNSGNSLNDSTGSSSFTEPPPPLKFKLVDIINAIKRIISDYFKGTFTRDFFLCFDKNRCVPISKSQAQAAHDKDKGIIPPDELPPLGLGLDEELPLEMWSSYMADRDGYRRDIISFLICELFRTDDSDSGGGGDELGYVKFYIPPNKRLIVDGHCLSLEQVQFLNVKNIHAIPKWDLVVDPLTGYSNIEYYPLALCEDSTNATADNLSPTYTTFLIPFYNVIGEADFLPYFILEKNRTLYPLSKGYYRYKHAEIISVDTDLCYLSLMYLHKRTIRELAEQRMTPLNITIRQSRLARYKNREYVDINMLYGMILNEPKLAHLKHKVLSVLFAMFAAGSDYTDYHYYVPYNNFLAAIYNPSVGDLLTMKIEKGQSNNNETSFTHTVVLNVEGYVRLLLYAYIYARKGRIPIEEAKNVTTQNINNYLDGTYGTTAATRKPLESAKLFPTPEDIRVSGKQMMYYMEMCYSVGDPEVNKLDPLEYGYELVDVSKGMIKGNIRRILIL